MDMCKKAIVPRLEELACQVSYKEVIGNLILCPENRPESKRLDWATFSSFLTTIPTLICSNIRDLVRGRLDQHLVGIVSDTVRIRFVKQFYEDVCKKSRREQIPDVWVFLNCVLDESFQELQTHIAFPGAEPTGNVVDVIADKSPLLKKLEITFEFMLKKKGDVVKLKPMFLSMSSLHHLTSLTLDFFNKSHKSLVSLLAKSCPLLSHLTIKAFNNVDKKYMVLAIVLGELVNHLVPHYDENPYWSKDENLWFLRVPPEIRTTLCSTLRHLALTEVYEEDYDLDDGSNNASDSLAAFALRHLPFLEELDLNEITSIGVKILHVPGVTENVEIQAAFENMCRDSYDEAPPRNVGLPSSIIVKGPLYLTKLDYVSLKQPAVLRSIGSMCPFLIKVHFYKSYSLCEQVLTLGRCKEKIPAEELESILGNWQMKLVRIKLTGVSSKFIKAILNALGSELIVLLIDNCHGVNVGDFMPCKHLEKLRILLFSSLDQKENLSSLNAETFLPKLKTFESEFCLGDRSRLFEEKSTLVNLSLSCSHIGTKVNPRLDWCGIPKLWSRMETLRVKHTTGLTMTLVGEIVPKLESLKVLLLPEDIKVGEHRSFTREVIENIADNRSSPIEIGFEVYNRVTAMPCRVSPRPKEEEEEPAAMDVDQAEAGLAPVANEEDNFEFNAAIDAMMMDLDNEFDDIGLPLLGEDD